MDRTLAGIVTLCVVGCAHNAARVVAAPVALAAGDYELVAEDTSGWLFTRQSRGSLSLRPVDMANADLARKYELYGWTDVDFKKLRAPFDASDIPGDSRDPHNPGVLVMSLPPGFRGFDVPQPAHAPILLIGTVDNGKASRGSLDGAGIGLFVQARDGACMTGEWSQWGVVVGGRGRFKICPRRAAQP
jgi:hypothetical protein